MLLYEAAQISGKAPESPKPPESPFLLFSALRWGLIAI
jgi:hypothetical protein